MCPPSPSLNSDQYIANLVSSLSLSPSSLSLVNYFQINPRCYIVSSVNTLECISKTEGLEKNT